MNNRQFIHCRVSRLGLFSCWVTVVYASPVRIVRQHLWPLLDNIAINTHGPWIIRGDFNTIMNSTERRGGCGNTIDVQFVQRLVSQESVM